MSSAVMSLSICFEIFALRFSAALGNMSKLYCARLHENWLRLGIVQVNLASALALHKCSVFISNTFLIAIPLGVNAQDKLIKSDFIM